jgi:hypothetical protein
MGQRPGCLRGCPGFFYAAQENRGQKRQGLRMSLAPHLASCCRCLFLISLPPFRRFIILIRKHVALALSPQTWFRREAGHGRQSFLVVFMRGNLSRRAGLSAKK